MLTAITGAENGCEYLAETTEISKGPQMTAASAVKNDTPVDHLIIAGCAAPKWRLSVRLSKWESPKQQRTHSLRGSSLRKTKTTKRKTRHSKNETHADLCATRKLREGKRRRREAGTSFEI